MIRVVIAACIICLMAACSKMAPGEMTSATANADIVAGPPMEDIVTDFDAALMCLNGKVPREVNFGVGLISDATGKDGYNDGGTGKYISQGAGDMVQSALFRAGVSVLNRRDPNIQIAESNWGIRDMHKLIPVDLMVTGSINSLDFIPGGASELSIGGVGPKYRQNRILIGMDLALTDTNTGRIIANIPIQKQLYAKEVGFDSGRFFGVALVQASVGGMQREAMQLTLRQMLSYATFELIAQTLGQPAVAPCRALIKSMDASPPKLSSNDLSEVMSSIARDARSSAAAREAAQAAPANAANPNTASNSALTSDGLPAPGQGSGDGSTATTIAPVEAAVPKVVDLKELTARARDYANRALADADTATKALTKAEAEKAASDGEQDFAISLQALRDAANAGLTGADGDDLALVVEKAMKAVKAARIAADAMPEDQQGQKNGERDNK